MPNLKQIKNERKLIHIKIFHQINCVWYLLIASPQDSEELV